MQSWILRFSRLCPPLWLLHYRRLILIVSTRAARKSAQWSTAQFILRISFWLIFVLSGDTEKGPYFTQQEPECGYKDWELWPKLSTQSTTTRKRNKIIIVGSTQSSAVSQQATSGWWGRKARTQTAKDATEDPRSSTEQPGAARSSEIAQAIARRNSTVITVIIQKRFAPTSSKKKKKIEQKTTLQPRRWAKVRKTKRQWRRRCNPGQKWQLPRPETELHSGPGWMEWVMEIYTRLLYWYYQ